jgi:hypothetical protein
MTVLVMLTVASGLNPIRMCNIQLKIMRMTLIIVKQNTRTYMLLLLAGYNTKVYWV